MKKFNNAPIQLKAKSLFKFRASVAGTAPLSTGDPTTITSVTATSVISNYFKG